MLTSILLTILALNVLVLVHEGGHYLVARRAGVKIYEFSIGFGPKLFGWKRNGIDYSVRSLFLGGYVRMAGVEEVIEGGQGDERLDEHDPGHFNTKPFWTRVGIIFAGPFANYVLAFVLFTLAFTLFGIPYDYASKRAVIGFVMPNSPAYQSGISAGDRVLSIGNQPVRTWQDMATVIRQNPERRIVMRVQRGKRVLDVPITPRLAKGVKGRVGEVGITAEVIYKRLGLGQSLRFAALNTYEVTTQTTKALFNIFSGKQRADVQGPVGLVGTVGQASAKGAGVFLTTMALISASLGYFNLIPLPLPLLDGGWIVIFILERLRGRPFKSEHKAMAQMAGLALVLALFVVITWSDVRNLILRYMHG